MFSAAGSPSRIRATTVAALLALLAAGIPSAARAGCGDRGPSVHSGRPRFLVRTLSGLSADGGPEIRVQVLVPHGELLFSRCDDGSYRARIELVVILDDARGLQVEGDLWSHDVLAADSASARSADIGFCREVFFAASPGRQGVRVSVRDMDSGAEGTIKHKLDVEDFVRLDLSMSDPRFSSCGAGDEGTGTAPFEPALVRGRFGGDRLPDLCVRGEIYDRADRPGGSPREYLLAWRIRDERGGERVADTLRVAREAGRSRFEFRPALAALSMGRYEMYIEARSADRKAGRCLTFEMDETRLSVLEDPAELLDLIGIVATESEVREWEQADPAARAVLWDEFWRRRDPSPGTPENEAKAVFFDRVRHANANFGSPGSPGWKSDRGTIYVRHGPPDFVESHPMNATDPPYEVWHYYGLGLRYVFADLGGFGQYVLVRE